MGVHTKYCKRMLKQYGKQLKKSNYDDEIDKFEAGLEEKKNV